MKTTLAVLAGLGCSCAASALFEIHTGAFGPSTANWTHAFGVQQFDDQGGTRVLDSVNIAMNGSITGDAQGENMDGEPVTVMLDLSGTLSLSLGLAQLVSVAPTAKRMFDAEAFDGTLDYAGASGESFLALFQQESTSALLTAALELAPWIGGGTLQMDGSATGASSGSGGGNLVTLFTMDGALDFEVRYTFHEVPAPGAAMVFGIAGVLGVRRRR